MNYTSGFAAILSAILFLAAHATGNTDATSYAVALAMFAAFCLLWYLAFEWRRG